MSSVSCVVLQESFTDASVRSGESSDGNLLSVLLWTIGSLFVCFNVEMSSNNTGILVSVTVLHVLLMMIATILLGKGLKESNTYLVLPWIALSVWNMYKFQCNDILRLFNILIQNHFGKIPWVSLIAYTAALIIRFHLTLRVAYVSLQQWYNKKLIAEIVQIKSE